MAELSKSLGAANSAATLLVLFIPSVDRDEKVVDQDKWAEGHVIDRHHLEIGMDGDP